MSLRATIGVINQLQEQGVIRRYAIAGAVAALNYIQPTLTEDLDVLISVDDFHTRKSGLLLLTPIEEALAAMGFEQWTDVGYMVGDWPIQFLPVSSPLDEESLAQAVDIDIGDEGSPPCRARCLRAEHVVATALKVGRLKELARIDAFLSQNAVDLEALNGVSMRHGLMDSWRAFCVKAGKKNPFG